jgi:hypothetical protein
MSPSRSLGSRSQSLAPRDGGWRSVLSDSLEDLLAAQSADLTATPELAARNAVVALGSALLERFGIHRREAGPLNHLSRLAAAVIGDVDLDDPGGAAQALAELFERSVGELGRREQGAVYTPSDVVDFMVRETIAARFADKVELSTDVCRRIADGDFTDMSDGLANSFGDLLKGLRLLDPAVGAGAFLVGAAMRIAELAQQLDSGGVPGLRNIRTPAGALRRCCHGYELDPQAVAIANVVLALATHDARQRLPPAVVTHHDPLLDSMSYPSVGGWDIIMMNPPYIGEKYIRNRLGADVSDALRRADGFSGDLLTHFVHRALGSVRTGGVVSAILSDTVFTIGAAAELRGKLIDESLLLSVAWCQPFDKVAVRGGVITVSRRPPRTNLHVEYFDAPPGTSIGAATPRGTPRHLFRQLPGRPIYRPSPAASAIIERWAEIDCLDELWHEVARRRSQPLLPSSAKDGWTLLGCAVHGGQGLATGDDRRFVGMLADTPEAHRAAERQRQILETIRGDKKRRHDWDVLRASLGEGRQLGQALVELSNSNRIGDLPGRKPFQVVDRANVRTTPLTGDEIERGIVHGPSWVPYETSDRSSKAGGARWVRETSVVIDWSSEAVALLRHRRIAGPRRPVLRNEDLWYQGGVTHNRIASYLRARMMPKNAIFSSESPVYIPQVSWLTAEALLALLNAPVVEFAIKTFLASRNHIEVGHIRRLPIPILSKAPASMLDRLGKSAMKASQANQTTKLADIEAELDRYTRELYGVGEMRLDMTR